MEMERRGCSRSPRPDTDEEQMDMDKLPSSTLKRHPRMDLNKTDMLQLLSYLEGELQARDIVIAALRMEKTKHLLYQAKCGHFGQADALYALQRDSDLQKDTSFGELAVKSMYDDQLIQLENLITTQHDAQHRMREQLAALEKRYHKMCAELDEEKLKHGRDLEQGDNVTYILEKDRERLKQELEFEKNHKKKMDKELKKLNASLQEQKQATAVEHKEVAVMLIKEQTKLMQKLVEMRQNLASIEAALVAQQQRVRDLQDSLTKASHKSMHVEAAMEKRFSELDFESEQLRSRIAKAEHQNRELLSERDRVRGLLAAEHIGRGGTADFDSGNTSLPMTVVRHPHGYVAERTVTPTPVTTTVRQARAPNGSQPARPTLRNKSPGTPPESKSNINMAKTLLETGATAMDCSGGQLAGNMTATNLPRKLSPIGRGVPPPIPPNKPQMFVSAQQGLVRPATDSYHTGGRVQETVLIAALPPSNQVSKHLVAKDSVPSSSLSRAIHQ